MTALKHTMQTNTPFQVLLRGKSGKINQTLHPHNKQIELPLPNLKIIWFIKYSYLFQKVQIQRNCIFKFSKLLKKEICCSGKNNYYAKAYKRK